MYFAEFSTSMSLSGALCNGNMSLSVDTVISTLQGKAMRKKNSNMGASSDALLTRGRNTERDTGSSQSRSKSKGKGKGKLKCWNCGMAGHMKKDCTNPKAKKENSEAPSREANTTTSNEETSGGNVLLVSMIRHLYDDHRDKWILDTRASYHMIPHRSWFTSYRECDGRRVFMGNDNACNVVDVGRVRIKMFDGMEGTLIEVRHIPNLKKNLISLSAIEAIGCKFTGVNSVLKVSKGALVVMRAQRHDNLCRLIGSTSIGGAAATVADSTSACMWHAHLDHMSKRGMKEEKNIATVQNVLAVIRGWEEPDRYILLGNHRDAWTYGAVDPNSGTAALLDIARRFGLLLRSGWHPRRTIVLCNWDAEEFGMIGSTEWVEQNLENLASKAVAYLNVDCAVQGPGFFASATPQLDNLLVEVTKQIKDPDSEGMTVYQTWVAANRNINVGRLSGMDSDFAAFVQHAGIASVDLYYGKDFPVYHTAFDSYDWMKKNGDPLFHRHVAVAGIWGLLALRLADDPILPFDYHSYAAQLQEHTKALSVLLDSDISLRPIKASIQELVAAANGIQELKKLGEQESMENPLELWRRALNDRLMLAERGFLGADGLKGRRWFKHLVYGPPNDHESKLSFFPGIADAISRGAKITKTERQSDVQHEIWRVARAIQRAAMVLRGELT
ncbi:probable glutamate carboxypeptidase PLA3 isoform X2 [Magnolia sinica]|uniref:probable glutamate carboxypeptidase PLA3 isoform X2 n=1 Tax=Magnolia sinica TaxID=86752 RepID=UPI002659F14B|nr:probable glutamate carboxypeptidase PLA3 isoform X2 [Magnolia sinica]